MIVKKYKYLAFVPGTSFLGCAYWFCEFGENYYDYSYESFKYVGENQTREYEDSSSINFSDVSDEDWQKIKKINTYDVQNYFWILTANFIHRIKQRIEIHERYEIIENKDYLIFDDLHSTVFHYAGWYNTMNGFNVQRSIYSTTYYKIKNMIKDGFLSSCDENINSLETLEKRIALIDTNIEIHKANFFNRNCAKMWNIKYWAKQTKN